MAGRPLQITCHAARMGANALPTVAAFMHLHSIEDYDRRTRHGHVADIVVAPCAQGRGIATTLLVQAGQWARRSGFEWLSISVFEQNHRALAIYEAAGFGKDIMRLVKPLGPPRTEPGTGGSTRE